MRVAGQQDFIEHLRDQMGFLRDSAAAYDQGKEADAKRLAAHLRTLLHDAGQSTSVLAHLGVKESLPWLDTAIAPDPTWTYEFALGLCRMTADPGPMADMHYVPPLSDLGPDRTHPPAAFVDWWNDPVLTNHDGHAFSRKDFARFVANQDGGAHVDANLDATYAALTRSNSLQVTGTGGVVGFLFGKSVPIDKLPGGPPKGSLALASIRQITYEVLATLDANIEITDDGIVIRDPICPLTIRAEVSTARNDPCPCGSGRKHKHCFGRRQPRNPRHTQSAAISMR